MINKFVLNTKIYHLENMLIKHFYMASERVYQNDPSIVSAVYTLKPYICLGKGLAPNSKAFQSNTPFPQISLARKHQQIHGSFRNQITYTY